MKKNLNKIDYNKEIWEGWKVKHFVEELEYEMDLINQRSPFKTKKDIKKYTSENQPYYKKVISEVVEHFCLRYNIK